MQILKSGAVSGKWPREKTCGHCGAILSFEKSDLFKTDNGIAFICPECGRDQIVKDIFHIDEEKSILSKEDFLAYLTSSDEDLIKTITSKSV